MNTQGRLISRFTQNLPPGRLEWIGLRPARKAAMVTVGNVMALEGLGLEGDRRCQGTPGSGRQVTLISREYIGQIEHFMAMQAIDPAILRRNLVVSGVNLSALRHQRFRIGGAEFEAGAWCHPCSRMEQALGEGAVAAMLGHGGICARIVHSGEIRVGDSLIKV